MFMLLVLDPASYKVGTVRSIHSLSDLTTSAQSHKDSFFDVLFESLATSELTMEHQYVSLLFSIDGLQHPLVDGIALQRGLDGDYLVTEQEFNPLRMTVIIRAYHPLHQKDHNLTRLLKEPPRVFLRAFDRRVKDRN